MITIMMAARITAAITIHQLNELVAAVWVGSATSCVAGVGVVVVVEGV
jgi:hypothetical protein